MPESSDSPGASNPTPNAPAAPRVYRAGEVLCRFDDLEDPGSKGPFLVILDSEETEIFVVRKDDKAHGYINVCPHRYLPLNWKDNAFLTFDKTKILCVVHAAIFNLDDGACMTTHCFEGLTPVTIAVENGDIRFTGEVGRPVEG
jgi:nitrite reductase/ring-hydroxylating ferredoxin subunit